MTSAIIITFCSLLLIAYIFDITSSKTKIPSVILLLLLGLVFRQFTNILFFTLPDFSFILPILGTIGLILIVLDGALELEFNNSKLGLINKSFFGTLIPLVLMSFLLAYFFHVFGNISYKIALINAIPFCIIGSAIAIPSVRTFNTFNKEYVIYESSLSDILGVIFFNFIILNNDYGLNSFADFGYQMFLIIMISIISTICISLLLSKIDHHIKFIPIILLIILIYSIIKIYHLPSLIFVLIFGLFIGNLDELKKFKWINLIKPNEIIKEEKKLKELTIEAAFLIRSTFFLLFGYLLNISEILNTHTFIWSFTIVAIIFIFRITQLKLSKLPIYPLVFIAPRGLITILLFLSIEVPNKIPFVNSSLVIQVILLTAIIMMIGLLTYSKKEEKDTVKSQILLE